METNAQTPVVANSTSSVVTPASATPISSNSWVYASFGRRLAALMLDGLVLWAVLTPVYAVVVIPMGILNSKPAVSAVSQVNYGTGSVVATSSTTSGNPAAVLASMGVIWTFIIAYLVVDIFLIGKYGKTLGKKVLGIKVVKMETGEVPGFGGAVLRELVGKFVSGVIPLYIGYLWMLWDSKKQTIHDKIGSTVVIKV